MKKTTKWIYGAFASVLLLLAGMTAAMADHPGGDVQLRDTSGFAITNGTTPYSPKATCSYKCHTSELPLAMQVKYPNDSFPGHNYGSGEKYSTHVQGVLDSARTVYWQAYQNKSYANGVSVGRHMNEGRNEDYTNANRAAVGDPFFTSSLGMWGKY